MSSFIAFTSEAAIENFREYLRIKTVQPNPDYDGAINFLKKMANQLQLPYNVYELKPKKPIFVMTWEGKNPALSSVFLNSHTDVVPVFPELWKHDPFSADMDENGDIHARGIQDMKSVGMQYIEAVRKLKSDGARFERTIHLSFVPDEEIGSAEGMQCFVQSEHFRRLNVGFGLDEGTASPSEVFRVFYSERLAWRVEITCTGQTGHGSAFIKDNAAEKLRRILNSALEFRDQEEARLESNPSLSKGDVATLNLTIIEGGVQNNVVPAKIKAQFDIRLPPTADIVESEEMIKKWCTNAGSGVTYTLVETSVEQGVTSTAADDPWWSAFSKAFSDMNVKMEPVVCSGATDARFLRAHGYPVIGFSPMNHTPTLPHNHNEYLNSSIFLKGIDIYARLITNLASVATISN